jgi:hypothetical protein
MRNRDRQRTLLTPRRRSAIFATGRESILPGRGLSGGWHKFAGGFIQAPVAAFPFFHRALPVTAVKFAQGRVFSDLLDNLVSKPPPDPTNRLVAFQLLQGHAVKPSMQFRGSTTYKSEVIGYDVMSVTHGCDQR